MILFKFCVSSGVFLFEAPSLRLEKSCEWTQRKFFKLSVIRVRDLDQISNIQFTEYIDLRYWAVQNVNSVSVCVLEQEWGLGLSGQHTGFPREDSRFESSQRYLDFLLLGACCYCSLSGDAKKKKLLWLQWAAGALNQKCALTNEIATLQKGFIMFFCDSLDRFAEGIYLNTWTPRVLGLPVSQIRTFFSSLDNCGGSFLLPLIRKYYDDSLILDNISLYIG